MINKKMETQKIYINKDKFIENILEDRKRHLNEIIDKLPSEELPFMEPHLRAIYFETYFLMAEGFYNASLVMCGIFLESLLKENLFMNKISDEKLEKMTFKQAIDMTRDMNLLTEQELKFFENKKNNLRNNYAHYNKMKLSEGFEFFAWKIPSGEIVPKIVSLLERTQKGEITEQEARQELMKGKPEVMTPKDLRPLSQTAKSEREKQFAPSIFSEIDKFAREYAKKYFKPIEK